MRTFKIRGRTETLTQENWTSSSQYESDNITNSHFLNSALWFNCKKPCMAGDFIAAPGAPWTRRAVAYDIAPGLWWTGTTSANRKAVREGWGREWDPHGSWRR